MTPWFLPYSTRKAYNIQPFTDSESIQKQYTESFPSESINTTTVVISETTSDEKNLEFLSESIRGLSENDIEVKIIWIIRNTDFSYLSQMEASTKYWGAEDMLIHPDTYCDYIDFFKKGYTQIIDLIRDKENIIISYKNLISKKHIVMDKIHHFLKISPQTMAYTFEDIDTSKLAGDPSFLNNSEIIESKDEVRKKEWEPYNGLTESLTILSLLFVNEFNQSIEEMYQKDIFSLNKYITKLIEQYFDGGYYLDTYPDIKNEDINPLEHYLSIGWKEDRNPNPHFNIEWYRDNISSDMTRNPWIDYLLKERFNQESQTLADKYNTGILENLILIDPVNYKIHKDLMLEAPLFKNPEVSIIVPMFNEEKYTLACIEAIIKNTDEVSYEIIIMDDCSSHHEAREIGKYMKNILFHSNPKNLGFIRNCNEGAKFAKGKYIMLLNNDTNVQVGWLSSLVSLIDPSKKIGMVGSKLVYPNGQLQDAGGILWDDASGWNFGRLSNPNKPEFNYVKEPDYLTGAAILIWKPLWDEIGGFDELYVPAYYDDPDLAFEVRKAGYKVLYQPKSVIIHFEGISNGTDLGSGVKKYQVINREKFLNKWKEELSKNQFPNAQQVFVARDRSARKKHLLFIDHYLPHYDKDAGSKATLQYLKLFVKNDIQVHFIGDNFHDYPNTPYLDTLTQLGIEVLHGEWYAHHWQDWVKENTQHLDYILLSRPHIAEKYIDFLQEQSHAKIIYFGHDLHYLRQRREYEIKQDKVYLDASVYWMKKELDLVHKSDVSFFFSEIEKAELLKLHPYASIDTVPLYIYDSFKDRETKIEDCSDIMFVGGFNHTPNTDAVLWFVEHIWSIIEVKIEDMKFYIIGSNPTEEVLALASNRIIVTGYVEDTELDYFYTQCKVVVAPLRYGAGIKGKVVDALYNAMPIVATSIAAEGLDDASSIMLIEDDAEQFAQKVLSLYSDNILANSYARKALEYCKMYFSEERAKSQMKHIFTEFEV
ncbi:MAG: glycosyltransferase [Sulfurovum sp.]|nr:glycosyltransferase [Sulfurovum sp.]